jgi:hypothetical protein
VKNCFFKWAWDGEAPRPDPAMSRQKAVVLLRAWRKKAAAAKAGKEAFELRRIAPGTFRATADNGQSGTMFVCRHEGSGVHG